MWLSDFQFYAELESPVGERLRDVRLDVDWIPALRWAVFEQAVRNEPPAAKRVARPRIEPLWSPDGEPPYIRGVTIHSVESGADPVEFPLTYFFGAVTAASAGLVDSGELQPGQEFDYRIYALSGGRNEDSLESTAEISPVDDAPAIVRRELATVTNGGAETTVAGRMPIVFSERVLAEATELAASADDVETGGILVGKLCRDPDGTVFSLVTAQIPAEHTSSTQHSLRFTPETWVSVDAAVRLRNHDETTLGWWHSHPFFCRKCTPLQRAACPFSKPTFSAADRDVHREVFQQPWNVALLLSFLGQPSPSLDVFAWNRGQIEAAQFTVNPSNEGNKGGVN
jgi:proteasome lid subunit RPN8/RPN11